MVLPTIRPVRVKVHPTVNPDQKKADDIGDPTLLEEKAGIAEEADMTNTTRSLAVANIAVRCPVFHLLEAFQLRSHHGFSSWNLHANIKGR